MENQLSESIQKTETAFRRAAADTSPYRTVAHSLHNLTCTARRSSIEYLVKKHYKDIVWPKGKKALLDELIEKSERRLLDYWEKYDKLEKDYERAMRDNSRLNRDAKMHRALILFLYVVCALFVLYLLGAVDFYSY